MPSVTCVAPVNIAVIKYWGKKNEELIIPLNDSISVTLSTDHLCAKTTVTTNSDVKRNQIVLNGKEESFDNPRLQKVLNAIKDRARQCESVNKDMFEWFINISSENNFPTAAGLASSAAGYACLVFALAKLFNLKDEEEISSIARLGSGSACRSVFGGFVQWKAGVSPADSVAVQLAPASHWPDIRILILVVNDQKKATSSTSGMSDSVKTSDLLNYRVKSCVPKRVEAMKSAILSKNFDKFANLTMRDSNQFHAVCLDTFPPCKYMNDVSHSISAFVHQYNTYRGENEVAYTFDAGPNACLYLRQEHVGDVLGFIKHVLPNNLIDPVAYAKGIPFPKLYQLNESEKATFKPIGSNLLKYIIHTEPGNGPKILVRTV